MKARVEAARAQVKAQGEKMREKMGKMGGDPISGMMPVRRPHLYLYLSLSL